jgi:hypothetical protein
LPPLRFGRRRPPLDIAALVLLLAGFGALALAVRAVYGTWAGALLPLAFIAGAFAGLRAEMREIELQQNALVLRTFFRAYTIPRAHVVRVMHDDRGASIEVLNGAHYLVTPPGVDRQVLGDGLDAWFDAGR